jgi:hypothetical protein
MAPTFIKSLTFSTIASDNNSKLAPSYYLDQPIQISEGYSVKAFQGVNTTYNIDSRNNRFSFNESTTSGTIRTFTIPSGNYTITTFMAAIKSGMDTAGTVVYTVTNNTLTNIVTITSASVTFQVLPIASDCYYEAGFVVSSSFSITQTAIQTYDLSGLKCVNIVCNAFGSGNSLVVNKNLNVICSIPIEVGYLGVINFNPPIVFIDSQISSISAFEFTCYDERYRPLTLANDWSIALLFEL